ncbi:hypothetical protein L6164_026475 [Bauhinia variegata]|uniref:Uncharacterized protein n=1 Tax=Bauhinia variegata TaxID=167791 RepID=A0ACB9LQP0_BAUVA|nr:hypothetical protein L6164_026475 [Bauhinia variegata]
MHNEIIGKDLFKVLQDKLGDDFDSFISEKVMAVAGDVSSENLGIRDVNLRKAMLEEIDIVLHSAASSKFDERAKKHGWPNTYVFTKAMGEMLVEHTKENLPIVIVRPTIISSTYKEPFPGWIEGVRTLDSFAIAYGKRKLTCFPGDIEAIVDVIPADMVVNTIIMAMVANANQCYDNIYHVGSSIRNPLRYINLSDYAHKYFTEKPWMDKDGKPVKVNGRITYVDMASFQRYIFDDMNLEKLRMAARQSGVEMDLFYFHPKMIDWEDYFINFHGPGIVKYLFK